jgi:hypothetical protein
MTNGSMVPFIFRMRFSPRVARKKRHTNKNKVPLLNTLEEVFRWEASENFQVSER